MELLSLAGFICATSHFQRLVFDSGDENEAGPEQPLTTTLSAGICVFGVQFSPDPANPPKSVNTVKRRSPKVGFVSLGCPKALVDSERILTRLRAEGYEVAPSYKAADLVVVAVLDYPAATATGFSIGTPMRLPHSVHEPS